MRNRERPDAEQDQDARGEQEGGTPRYSSVRNCGFTRGNGVDPPRTRPPMSWIDGTPDPATWWRDDAGTEVSIDVVGDPVVVTLDGTLDGPTSANLFAVVEELLGDGRRDFELRAPTLEVVVPSGRDALARLAHVVRERGGRLRGADRWAGAAAGEDRTARGRHGAADDEWESRELVSAPTP